MDNDEMFSQARARFDHEAARRNLREKYQAKMIFGHRGGLFRACAEMIAFLNIYQDQDIVVQDLYENPVAVNAGELCAEMKSRLQEQMNAWLAEYDRISQQR